MKTQLLGLLTIITLSGCKHSSKDPDLHAINTPSASKDEISMETVSDRFGDQMEIITNTTKNSITLRLNEKTYQLKKNQTTPGFSTEDNKYLFTETQDEVTFLKKDIDMVLFHGKKNQAESKMASQ